MLATVEQAWNVPASLKMILSIVFCSLIQIIELGFLYSIILRFQFIREMYMSTFLKYRAELSRQMIYVQVYDFSVELLHRYYSQCIHKYSLLFQLTQMAITYLIKYRSCVQNLIPIFWIYPRVGDSSNFFTERLPNFIEQVTTHKQMCRYNHNSFFCYQHIFGVSFTSNINSCINYFCTIGWDFIFPLLF